MGEARESGEHYYPAQHASKHKNFYESLHRMYDGFLTYGLNIENVNGWSDIRCQDLKGDFTGFEIWDIIMLTVTNEAITQFIFNFYMLTVLSFISLYKI